MFTPAAASSLSVMLLNDDGTTTMGVFLFSFCDFFCGVPDSLLKSLCDYLMNTYGIDGSRHIIAANEGNCVGIAAGYHLATGKVPVIDISGYPLPSAP